MKSFFKYLLATILGVFISMGLLVFIGIGMISVIMSTGGEKKVQIESNSVLKLTLDYPIPERTSNDPLENFDFQNFKMRSRLGLNDLLSTLEQAQTDPNIEGIYLDLTMLPTGLAKVEEIREALVDFKKTDKFIIAYSEIYTEKAYYLASVADKIYLNPQGHLLYNGLQSKKTFFKEGLDKLGIDVQVITGPENVYKSAVEPFNKKQMSSYDEKQTRRYVSAIWGHMLKKISASRNIPVDILDEMAENFEMHPSEQWVESGMITAYKYKDEVISTLKKHLDIERQQSVPVVSPSDYHRSNTSINYTTNDKIAIVYGNGKMILGQGDQEAMGSERISHALREARNDSAVQAVVLRVNSGGGSALAAEVIWREVKLIAEQKTMIVSMSSYAASGGYYIGAPADTILAGPTTITGSIGAFGVIPNAGDLLNDKLGIYRDEIKTNQFADMFSLDRPMTSGERKIVKDAVGHTYKVFVSRIAEGRDLNREEVHQIGRGKIWSGIGARKQGLIDLFGGLSKAIDVAAEKADVSNYRLVEYPQQKSPFQQMIKGFRTELHQHLWQDHLPLPHYKQVKTLKDMIKRSAILARMPYKPAFN